MEFPDRKSKKLERAMIMFKKDLNELQLNHKAASDEILEKIKQLLDSNGEDITIMKNLEDLDYELDNDILVDIENALETIGGFEISFVGVDDYLQIVKEEQDILKDLELSAKNLIKAGSTTDNSLKQYELENLSALYESYMKTAANTQEKLNDISEELQSHIHKVKKMEVV